MFGAWRLQRKRQELYRVSSLIDHYPLEEVLRDLDAIDTRGLPPYDVALWLNNRAYVHALLGSTTEALDSLTDAEDLLLGSEETDPVYDVENLRSCIVGTRGIALLHAGQLDEAERHLQDAFDRGAPHLTSTDARVLWMEQTLAAERLWWLALIADKRGADLQRLELLRRASSFSKTRYGEKAKEALLEDSP